MTGEPEVTDPCACPACATMQAGEAREVEQELATETHEEETKS